MITSQTVNPRALRPRSRPFARSAHRLKPGWRHRIADSRRRPPKGALTFWTRARRLFWSWWPWAIVSIWAISDARWGWAIGCGAMALVSYLLTPAADPPRFGLDHEFAVESPEFVKTMAGASGNPFLPGNRLELLNNGDAFYPAMLEAIKSAQCFDHGRGLHLLGRRHRTGVRDRAGGTGDRQASPSSCCWTPIGSSSIGPEILEVLETGGCQIAWYNPIHWYTLGRFNNRTHRKSLIIDGRIAFTGGAGIADHWRGNARGPDEWRDLQVRIEGPAVVPLQTGFAHNWQQTTGELLSGDTYYPTIEPSGSSGSPDAS